MKRPRRSLSGVLLVSLGLLLGCGGPEPKPEESGSTAAEESAPRPNEQTAPPLGKPRAKKLPGDVLNQEADDSAQ